MIKTKSPILYWKNILSLFIIANLFDLKFCIISWRYFKHLFNDSYSLNEPKTLMSGIVPKLSRIKAFSQKLIHKDYNLLSSVY